MPRLPTWQALPSDSCNPCLRWGYRNYDAPVSAERLDLDSADSAETIEP